MHKEEQRTIPQMCEDVRAGKMSRRNFIKTLIAMGISVAGIAAITAGDSASKGIPRLHTIELKPERQLHLHEQHLANQTQGNVNALQNDYAEHAVVEDSMYAQPFVGRQAIMARKRTSLGAIPDLKINVTNRVVHGNQVTVEWIATGTHTGDFPASPPPGAFSAFQASPLSYATKKKSCASQSTTTWTMCAYNWEPAHSKSCQSAINRPLQRCRGRFIAPTTNIQVWPF